MRYLVMAVILLAVGCTDKKTDQPAELDKRQRDSIIGESRLPGAQGVRGALRAADSAAARQRRAEEIK